MKIKLSLLFLLLPSIAVAQPLQNVKIDFSWQHDGQFTTGFRLYKGPTPGALVKAVDIPGGSAIRSYSYSAVDTLPECFGLSAYGPSGESAIMTKTPAGVDVCLGKPVAPTSFSFSVP